MRAQHPERGAAAVEFALVLPALLLLVLGIIDFGRIFSAQQTLTYAARAGARVMVLQNSQTAAVTAAQNAASPLGQLPSSSFAVSPSTCTSGTQVAFTVNYTFSGTGFFGTFPLQGKGVMLCGG
ncbi:Flp pilus assembly protein TadG [Sinomonas atrocyanea]|uniref:TadE/TadG family type IV pilus assembly protein n=1 Tax=Sinomonas atrocyanea TaxID=37927 RepID=UPI0027855409|nr:TadE family protein [Sinomonas atrocyanea]MDP9884815.1 Flp pilus assembly protein TadG [Sinomonas atrocyanea]